MKTFIITLLITFLSFSVYAQDGEKPIEVDIKPLKSDIVIVKVIERGYIPMLNKRLLPEIQIADGDSFQLISLNEMNISPESYHAIQSANTNALIKVMQQIRSQGYRLTSSNSFQSPSNPESMIIFSTYVFTKE